MENLLLIIICLVAGYALRNHPSFAGNGAAALRTFIVYFCLPAVVLKYIPALEPDSAVWGSLASGFVVWAGAWVLFKAWGTCRGWDRQTIAVLILMAGLGNTSFVGFPLIATWFGDAWISYAIFADQSAFLVMATLGISLATRTATGTFDLKVQIRKLTHFPPFIAFIIAVGLQLAGWTLPNFWTPLMSLLSAPLVPLAIFSVGLQLNFQERFTEWPLVIKGLLYKLMIAPFIVWLLFKNAIQSENPYAIMAVFEAAMAPMITAFILASQYGIRPKVAAMLVGVGIPVSVLTTGLWYWLLKG
jgi:predicted permease